MQTWLPVCLMESFRFWMETFIRPLKSSTKTSQSQSHRKVYIRCAIPAPLSVYRTSKAKLIATATLVCRIHSKEEVIRSIWLIRRVKITAICRLWWAIKIYLTAIRNSTSTLSTNMATKRKSLRKSVLFQNNSYTPSCLSPQFKCASDYPIRQQTSSSNNSIPRTNLEHNLLLIKRSGNQKVTF